MMKRDELDRILKVRDKRLKAIGDESPVAVFHLVPETAVSAVPKYCDLSTLWEARRELLPLTGSGDSGYDHLGFLNKGDKGHLRVFHSGSIEATGEVVPEFNPCGFAEALVECLSRCYQIMKGLLDPSFTNTVDVVAMLSILGAKECRFVLHQEYQSKFEEGKIKLPEHVFVLSRMDERKETLKPGQEDDRPSKSQRSKDAAKNLRPILDRLWNAGGLERCDLYDDEGNWDGRHVRA